MSDLEARIAEVVSKHIPNAVYYNAEEGHVACHGCDWAGASFSGFYDHQAAMLAPVIREAQAEAWDECVHVYDSMVCLDCEPNAPTNPYRADNLATP